MPSFKDQIDDLVARVLPRVEREVPQSGYFADVYEIFYNTDEETKYIADKFRLKVLKMPSVDVPDPEKRYIEAAVFEYGGNYKEDMLVGAGKKDDIIALLKSPEFHAKLYRVYNTLLDMLR